MPTRSYNNPAFAQAAQNLAGLFAPPSGAEAAGWASANAQREQAARLQWLYENYNDPSASQRSALTGVQSYGNTPDGFARTDATNRYGIDSQAATAIERQRMQEAGAMDRLGITDATTRRGQDVDATTRRYGIDTQAGTALETNRLDNQTRAIGQLYQPLNPDQVRPEVPDELLEVLGLPGGTAGQTQGVPGRMSRSEVEAEFLQALSPEEQRAVAYGSTPVENIVTEEGPRTVARVDAIGQEPYFNRGAEARPQNAMALLADGSRVPATQDVQTGRWRHSQTGEELPADVQIFGTPNVQGSAEDVGLTSATQSRVQQQVISLDQTLGTARRLRQTVADSPSSQGLVGSLRGTAQDIIQTGGDLGEFFQGGVAEVARDIESGLADAGLAGDFDPNIPAIQMLTNLLAWQYAKSLSGDRVSNEQLRAAREAIGGTGMFANRANTLTRLDQLIGMLEGQREQLGTLAPGVGLGGMPAQASGAQQAPQQSNRPQPGTVEGGYRFRGGDPGDPNAWERVE